MNKREILDAIEALSAVQQLDYNLLVTLHNQLGRVHHELEQIRDRLEKPTLIANDPDNRCKHRTIYNFHDYQCEVIGVPHANHIAYTPEGTPIPWDGEKRTIKLNWLDSDAEQCSARDDNNLRCLILGKHASHLTSTGICHRW